MLTQPLLTHNNLKTMRQTGIYCEFESVLFLGFGGEDSKTNNF